MRVALAARDIEKLAALRREIGSHAFACDAADPDQVARLFDNVESKIGAPDVVVYNASARVRGPLIELAPPRLNGPSPLAPSEASWWLSKPRGACFRRSMARSCSRAPRRVSR